MDIFHNSHILFASHGATERLNNFNVLTAEGLQQATTLAKEIHKLNVIPALRPVVYCSPFPCTVQTAGAVAKTLSCTFKASYLLTNRANSFEEVAYCGVTDTAYKKVLVDTSISQGVADNILHFDDFKTDLYPEEDEDLIRRTVSIAEKICEEGSSPPKLIVMITHRQIVDLLASKYETTIEGSSIKFISLKPFKFQSSFILYPLDAPFVTISKSDIEAQLSRIIASSKKQHNEKLARLQKRVQAKQDRIREQQAKNAELAEALKAQTAKLFKYYTEPVSISSIAQQSYPQAPEEAFTFSSEPITYVDPSHPENESIEGHVNPSSIYYPFQFFIEVDNQHNVKFIITNLTELNAYIELYCYETQRYFDMIEIAPNRQISYETDLHSILQGQMYPQLSFVVVKDSQILSDVVSLNFQEPS